MTGQLFVTPFELDFLWESFGSGELPYPLEVRSHGATVGERRALRQRVFAGLQQRQLLDSTGRPSPQVEDWLMLLAAPELSVDALFLGEPGGGPQRVLAAAAGEQALLARQDDQGLHLGRLPATALASSVVDALPGAPRGTEKSINVLAEELSAPGAGDTTAAGGGRSTDEETRKALTGLLGQHRSRGGQIAANARGRIGGPAARSRVLAWFDAESGRYLTLASGGADGREWISIAPADAPTLRRRVAELLWEAQSAVTR